MRSTACLLVFASVLVMTSCTPEAEEAAKKEAEAQTVETAGVRTASMEQIYEALSTEPFEEPLPENRTLVRLTAVEMKKRSVVEFIDPQLTNADAGTALVVTYVLAPEQAAVQDLFRRYLPVSPDGTASGLDGAPIPTMCAFPPDDQSASCVSAGTGYVMQTGYAPAEPAEDLDGAVRDIVTAAHNHIERVIDEL